MDGGDEVSMADFPVGPPTGGSSLLGVKGSCGGVFHQVNRFSFLGYCLLDFIEDAGVLVESAGGAGAMGLVVHANLELRPGPVGEGARLGVGGGEGNLK